MRQPNKRAAKSPFFAVIQKGEKFTTSFTDQKAERDNFALTLSRPFELLYRQMFTFRSFSPILQKDVKIKIEISFNSIS